MPCQLHSKSKFNGFVLDRHTRVLAMLQVLP